MFISTSSSVLRKYSPVFVHKRALHHTILANAYGAVHTSSPEYIISHIMLTQVGVSGTNKHNNNQNNTTDNSAQQNNDDKYSKNDNVVKSNK